MPFVPCLCVTLSLYKLIRDPFRLLMEDGGEIQDFVFSQSLDIEQFQAGNSVEAHTVNLIWNKYLTAGDSDASICAKAMERWSNGDIK